MGGLGVFFYPIGQKSNKVFSPFLKVKDLKYKESLKSKFKYRKKGQIFHFKQSSLKPSDWKQWANATVDDEGPKIGSRWLMILCQVELTETLT